jgi:ubiquinone/menaquinone biosynthesis C-methylase UbiE
VFASLGGEPAFLLGIDIADGALRMAERIGYTPLRVDAHSLPLVSAFADVVAMNATIHRCDHMATVLAEAARLVKPGGILVTDHTDREARKWMLAGEIHHDAGDGMTEEEFRQVLEPLSFKVKVYRHDNDAGAEALDGVPGRAGRKMGVAQRLSGIDPRSASGAITLMCVAKHRVRRS